MVPSALATHHQGLARDSRRCQGSPESCPVTFTSILQRAAMVPQPRTRSPRQISGQLQLQAPGPRPVVEAPGPPALTMRARSGARSITTK